VEKLSSGEGLAGGKEAEQMRRKISLAVLALISTLVAGSDAGGHARAD